MSKKIFLVPELRFPEFWGKSEWNETSLSKICKVNPAIQKLPDSFVYIDLESVEAGRLLKKNIITRAGAPSRAQRLLKAKDVLFQMVRPYQKNNFYFNPSDDLEYVASTGYAQLRANESSEYLFQYLHSDQFAARVLTKCTGSNYPAINSGDLSKIKVEVPSKPEQHKIAECLSSLDELIKAHTKKYELLVLYRKSLLQNVLPSLEERVPKLRLHSFSKNSSWKKRKLGDFIKERNQFPQNRLPLFSLTIEDGVSPKTERYERSFLVKNEEEAYKLVKSNDFAYNPMNLRFGAIGRYSGEKDVVVSKYYNIFYCDKSVDTRFCEIYLKSPGMITHYDNVATGSLIEKRRVHFSEFLKFEIPFPSLKEQQAIADCLSSVDRLIIAQKQKVAELKSHKIGLMQKLFPSMDEVDA